MELSHWSWDPDARGPKPVPIDSLPTLNDRKHRESKVEKLRYRLHPDDLQTWVESDYMVYPIDLVKARDAQDKTDRWADKQESNASYSAYLVRCGISMQEEIRIRQRAEGNKGKKRIRDADHGGMDANDKKEETNTRSSPALSTETRGSVILASSDDRRTPDVQGSRSPDEQCRVQMVVGQLKDDGYEKTQERKLKRL